MCSGSEKYEPEQIHGTAPLCAQSLASFSGLAPKKTQETCALLRLCRFASSHDCTACCIVGITDEQQQAVRLVAAGQSQHQACRMLRMHQLNCRCWAAIISRMHGLQWSIITLRQRLYVAGCNKVVQQLGLYVVVAPACHHFYHSLIFHLYLLVLGDQLVYGAVFDNKKAQDKKT